MTASGQSTSTTTFLVVSTSETGRSSRDTYKQTRCGNYGKPAPPPSHSSHNTATMCYLCL
jgi:hypothetical protein